MSSPLVMVGLIVLFVLLLRGVRSIHEKASLSAEKLKSAELELAKLQDHERDLSSQIGYLSTEQGIEAELRTKYRAVREGESVAVIIGDQASSSSATSTAAVAAVATATTTASSGSGGFFHGILQWLGL